ncbi:hypothetical protein A1O1_00581 [Capronia coronata CBS 617.96]|uniref:Homeobox domain-containing protein n=1 Tax=Capronia coronata CBS 617.96 TaxID=1182541 RepID=W9ZLU6_9EURO|nr:uncharacterized protein A1O1_00581 [Capronia coronata CBS 617.96]EXJ95459.1 hypothetical protein A1O1_00581 [Capronia coronata CBS 617.96]
MTKRTFQPPSVASKSDPPSPEHSQAGTSVEGFDNMSARSVESSYPMPHHQRRSSSWNSSSQYGEMVGPYNAPQRVQYSSQTPFPSSRASPSLPPIRDIGGYDSQYPPPAGTYSQTYGAPPGVATHGVQDTYSYTAERPAYYDTTGRYGQGYPPANRPSVPQVDYARYAPSPYEYRAGVAYQSPYGPTEYASSPSTVHHPSSPTVGMDTETRNRRRRGNLPRQITDILRAWFHEHLDHPYPTEEDKQAFMARTGLTIAQISNWFINARRRQLPALRHARDRGALNPALEYDPDQVRRQHQPESALR